MDDIRDSKTHLTTEQLLDYIERRLGPDEMRRVETHLAGDCSACQSELGWLNRTLNLMLSDVWVDAPVRLQSAARQIYRDQYSVERESFSISEWLQALFAPRRPLVYAAIGIVLVVIVAGLLLQPWSTSSEDGSAEVAAYRGTVEVQSPGSDTWKSVKSAEEVNTGDNVRTGEESTVVLSYPDESKTLVLPHTELKILKMSLDEGEEGDQIIVLEQQFGRTHNYVQPLPTAGSRFEIRTPAATVTVRGTSFSVDVEENGTTRVAVSEGRVLVAAEGKTIALVAGEATTVEFGGSPSVVEPVPTVPIPSEFATLAATIAPGSTPRLPVEPTDEVEATETPRPSATATSSLTPSPSPVYITETPTLAPTSVPGPTEPPNNPRPTNTPAPTQPSATSLPPPPTATSEPPPTPEPTDEWVPPGQTKTPQPPGQTREAPPGNSGKIKSK